MSVRYTNLIILAIYSLALSYSTNCLGYSIASQSMTTDATSASETPLEHDAKLETFSEIYLEDDGIPWGMAWLPQGDMLISFRAGKLKRLRKGSKSAEVISGLPKIAVGGQGGLLDVIVHPDFTTNGWLYFSYSKENSKGNKSTAIMRAKLDGNNLTEQKDIYIAQAYGSKGVHFGSRLAFDNQGYLYFSIGDRGQRDINPQDITRDGGKVYRLHDDGRIPSDNPFIDKAEAKKAIFSYGHRNPQGLATHPTTGAIWSHEHGPRGGDEVNLIGKGKNYGWPVISYGINYSGTKFTKLTEKQGMEQPLWYWDPSIAPSGMTFVTSDKYPQWQGNILVGSLKFGQIVMLSVVGNVVKNAQVIKEDLTRIRNVKQGPDGYIYLALDGQGIFRLKPK